MTKPKPKPNPHTATMVATMFDNGMLSIHEHPPHHDPWGREVHKISIMSRHAGGECRGYTQLDDGPWLPSSPCYTGQWPAMDRAVEAQHGLTIHPYTISAGGMVEAAEVTP